MLLPRASLPLSLLILVGCPQQQGTTPPATPPAAQGSATGQPPAAPVARGSLKPLGDNDVVASVRGQPVLAKEVMGKLRAAEARAEAEYLTKVAQQREDAVKGLVLDRLLLETAKKAGFEKMEDWLKSEADKAIQPADDARLRALYAQLVPAGEPPFEMVKMQLVDAARAQDRQKGVGAVVERVIKENDVKWLLPQPVLPRVDVSADDDPVLGNKDAKVTIIEFSDFECPFCARAAESIHDVVKKYDGKVKLVFRDFPLSFHPRARAAAQAAGCANEQGKFWAFHDAVFKNQQTPNGLEDKALQTYARLAGVDGEKFDKCVAAGTYAAEVEKDYKDGEAVGVEGTPSFFINGRPYTGSPTPEEMSAAIDAALAEVGG